MPAAGTGRLPALNSQGHIARYFGDQPLPDQNRLVITALTEGACNGVIRRFLLERLPR